LLSNVFLHYVLDLWFEQDVKPRLCERAFLVRYADDFEIGFRDQRDAQCVMEFSPKRSGKYGLTVHPTKTKLRVLWEVERRWRKLLGPGRDAARIRPIRR
jgi:RNA-directed DNA polymerase